MESLSQSNPWIGHSVGDYQRYRLDKPLAVGGMGEIFVAMDTLIGKQVALKLLKDTSVASAELRKRFEREVALCAALKSDHIVEVSDYGVTVEGYPFFVMEYLPGQSLGQLLRQKQRMPLERTVNLITQVCDGLQLAHEGVTLWRDNATVSEQIKVVHRDLKPDNIFLVPTALGELVKILDFGIAKIRETQVEETNLTNMFLGTFHYAAPEQLEVDKDLDGRTDIYSLGMIIYEMLSGTDPFGLGLNINDGPISNMSWALAHTLKPPVPLRVQPGLSQISLTLEAVVMRCLKKLPDERFASVEELKQALQAAISKTHQPQQNLEQKNKIIDDVNAAPGGFLREKVDSTELQATEKHNLNPSLMIRQTGEGEKDKKTRQLLLKITGVAAVVGIGYYSYAQGQIQQSEQAALEMIQMLKDGKNYQACVNKAEAILLTSPFFTKAQNLTKECRRLAQDEQLLTQAQEQAKQKNFQQAISQASQIQPDSSLRSSAQQLIDQWSLKLVKQAQQQYKQSYSSRDLANVMALIQAIPQSSSVTKSLKTMREQWRSEWHHNQQNLQAAHNELQQGKWQEAIEKTRKVRLLGQEVKPNTPYWQHQLQPIVAMAQDRLAAGAIWGSRTNQVVQPELPSPQFVPSLVPTPAQPRFVPSPVRYLSPPPVSAPAKPKLVRTQVSAPVQPELVRAPVPHLSPPPVATPAQPQSPIHLSLQGQRILCKQFPLNSRCSHSEY